MRLILAAAIALSSAAPAPALAQPAEAARSDCIFMPESDLSRFTEEPEVMAKAEAAAQRSARDLGLSLKPPKGFTAGRIVIVGSRGYKGGPDAIVAFRAPDGRWFVRARAPAVDLRRGRRMTADETPALETALADSCLTNEPDRAPRSRPSRYKGELIVCADGQDSFFDIDVPTLRRKLFHECAPRGAAYRLKAVLQGVAFGVRP